jgi:hypothetical protein
VHLGTCRTVESTDYPLTSYSIEKIMTVKVFRSTDYGAPANTNAAGALIAILDACLVNGYGSQTVGITSTGGVATVTTPVAHALKDGTFMRISGANESAYNGDFAITVTGATTFTYAVTGSPASPATGTITSKVAPADWTKPFSTTNVAAYKQGAGSNGMYLRVSDTTTSAARVKAFENMTDVNTGTGDFPTEAQIPGGRYLQKGSSATAIEWFVIASEKLVFTAIKGTSYFQVNYFGDFISNKSGDAFNTVFRFGDGGYSDGGSLDLSSLGSVSAGMYIARAHTQIGSAKQVSQMGNTQISTSMGNGGVSYPDPISNALLLSPISIGETGVGVRGKLPCIWQPLHVKPFQHGDIITGTGDFSGKKFIAITGGYNESYQTLLEFSNTW